MKKILILFLGCMIAGLAAWAVPREVKKDHPGIEKSIKLKIEIVKMQIAAIATIVEQGESPGQPSQQLYSINTDVELAIQKLALPPEYGYDWRTQNTFDSNKNLAMIKLGYQTPRRFSNRC